MTVMLWRLDAGDIAGALEIAPYALKYGLTSDHRRTTPYMLVEEVALAALRLRDAGEPVDLALLLTTLSLLALAVVIPVGADLNPGVRLLLISDSCHSGSVTRGDDSALDPGGPRARFLPPEAWMKTDELPAAARASTLAVISGIRRTGSDLLLAGCRDQEYSWDTSFAGRPNGAFTFYALKTLREKKPSTYEQWHAEIRKYLPTNRLPQEPQIFGTRTARKMRILD